MALSKFGVERRGTRGSWRKFAYIYIRWVAESVNVKMAEINGKEIQRALDSEVAVGREISRSNSRVC